MSGVCCHASFEEAVAWVEAHRPGVGDRLRELRAQARDAARARNPTADPGGAS